MHISKKSLDSVLLKDGKGESYEGINLLTLEENTNNDGIAVESKNPNMEKALEFASVVTDDDTGSDKVLEDSSEGDIEVSNEENEKDLVDKYQK